MGYFGDVIDAPWMAGSAGAQPRGYFGALRDPQFYRDVAGNAAGLLGVPLPSEREGMAMLAADPRMQAGDVNVARMMTSPGEQAKLAQGWDDKMNALGLLGLTVYQGSPYKFPPTERNPLGEFDASKIGTGEGAQAYGHGHYVAEAKDVGKGYAERLAKRAGMDARNFGAVKAPALTKTEVTQMYDLKSKLNANAYRNGPPLNEAENAIWDKLYAKNRAYEDAVDAARPVGYLYTVELADDAIPKMLDYDKPLSQQSENVRNALNSKFRVVKENNADYPWVAYFGDRPIDAAPTRKALLSQFEQNPADVLIKGADPYGVTVREGMSETLRDLGIPGIKYLDAGSRAAGEGSRNFVVFPGNEGLLTIKGRQ